MRSKVWQLLIVAAVVFAPSLLADERANGWCEQGGHPVVTGVVNSVTQVQVSYPRCTITVYNSGTVTPATIYSDNGITPLANPFTANQFGFWGFYAANGVYDVQLSGSGIATPFTIGAVTLFDVTQYVPPTQVCGTDTQVQYNHTGAFGCDANFTWGYGQGLLTVRTACMACGNIVMDSTSASAEVGFIMEVNGVPKWNFGADGATGGNFFVQDLGVAGFPQIIDFVPGGNSFFNPESGTVQINSKVGIPALVTNLGFIQSQGGFLSNANEWNAFQSNSDGALLRGYGLAQNAATSANGGYIDIAPITYNPYDSGSCIDANGNPVQQPLPLNGLSAFGAADTILWVGTSPQMPPSGSCGAPLPINTDQGLFLNSYLFARAGLATDSGVYNAINTIYLAGGRPAGGVEAGAITAGTLYPAGTTTSTGVLGSDTYLGGYMAMGFSNGVPGAGTDCVSIALCTNPLADGDGIEVGTFYWDTGLNCVNVFGPSSWNCLAGGGGGGSPGGANTDVQYNSSGAFAGSGNMTWNNTNQVLTVIGKTNTAGIAVGSAYIQSAQGFLATGGTCTTITCIQAPGGGIDALAIAAVDYMQLGNGMIDPTAITGDTFHAGAAYFNTGTACSGSPGLRIFNGTSWSCLGSGSGSPGGADTNIQFNSMGSFGGSANMVWDNTNQIMTISAKTGMAGIAIAGIGGYGVAQGGWQSNNCSAYNCFQAVNGGGTLFGGFAGVSFTAANYVQTGTFTGGAPTLTTSDTFHAGALAYSLTNSCESLFNGSTWNCLAGGGGGSAAGPLNAVQFNSPLGTFAGSSNFVWDNTNQVMTISAKTNSAGIAIAGIGGYGASQGGWISNNCTNFNCFQPVNGGGSLAGGMAALSFSAANYIQTGNANSTPALTTGDSYHAGAMYWNNISSCEEVYNGASFSCLSSAAGVTALNSFTGSVSIIGTTNQITVGNASNIITLSTPQNLNTTANIAWNSVNVGCGSAGSTQFVVQSCATGASVAFQTSNNDFIVDGQGDVTALTQYNTGASGVYKQNGTTVIDASRNASFVGGTFSSALNVNGGLIASTSTNSTLHIGTGNFYTRPIGGVSTGVSCSGIADGWLAISSDDFVVVCLGGARFRAAIASF